MGDNFLQRLSRAAAIGFSDPEQFCLRLVAACRRGESGTILINGVKFRIDLALDPAMRLMRFGVYQLDLVRLLRRLLRPGDTFIDVGANVGYITAVALGLVGKAGRVHAFEPVPQFLRRLRFIQDDNPDFQLHVNGCALGEQSGFAEIAVSNLPNIGWNTMVPEFMPDAAVAERLQVPVATLDDYLATNHAPNLRLVKIDTEGYELSVIHGLIKTLEVLAEPPVLVVEVAPAAYPRMGSSIGELARTMADLGYNANDITLRHRIKIEDLRTTSDVVFMRDQ